MRARSFFPLGLMPAVTPLARIPGTAVTPPSSHSRSGISNGLRSRVHRRSLETAALVPPVQDVQVLDAVGRASLAEIVDGRDAHSASRAAVGDHGHVAVIGPNDGAGAGPLSLPEHPHERLLGIELLIDGNQVG